MNSKQALRAHRLGELVVGQAFEDDELGAMVVSHLAASRFDAIGVMWLASFFSDGDVSVYSYDYNGGQLERQQLGMALS